ncbi:MAG: calcium/sodium antiporter [Woeseiaceae bacterium]|nr:calcium/sodium antiporter [Woeseiaceae bacterium]
MLAFAGIVLGLVLLIGGGALLVRGASELATTLGISPMIVGLTIVGFGTSAPELVVNIIGALEGETGLAFGNVVGSNISNLGLVLGAAALMTPIALQGDAVRRELPLFLLATTMMAVMALDGPLEGEPARIGRSDSILLMLMFCIFLYFVALDLKGMREGDKLFADIGGHTQVLAPGASRWQWLLIIGGCGLLFLGGEITIRNGIALSERLGVAPAIVGLFVVAVGTSMPELVTSVIAAIKDESDLALGNVIGSNIFNSLIVLPVSGLIAPIRVPAGGVGDLVVSWLLAAAILPVFLLGSARLGRPAGALFIVAYACYAIARISGG